MNKILKGVSLAVASALILVMGNVNANNPESYAQTCVDQILASPEGADKVGPRYARKSQLGEDPALVKAITDFGNKVAKAHKDAEELNEKIDWFNLLADFEDYLETEEVPSKKKVDSKKSRVKVVYYSDKYKKLFSKIEKLVVEEEKKAKKAKEKAIETQKNDKLRKGGQKVLNRNRGRRTRGNRLRVPSGYNSKLRNGGKKKRPVARNNPRYAVNGGRGVVTPVDNQEGCVIF